MKNKFHERDHLAPLAVLSTTKEVAQQAQGVVKALGGYKISKGSHHKKLAAAINFLRSLGYSTEQIQSSPLRQVVDLFGSWPESIKDTVNGGVPKNLPKVLTEKRINIQPDGNFGTYVKPSDSPAQLTEITREIYGPSFPEYGQKLPASPEALLVAFPPLSVGIPTPASMMQAISETSKATQTSQQTTQKDIDVSILKPVAPVMTSALQDSGYVAPRNLDSLAVMFYEKIVAPSTMQNSIDETIVDSILTFIGGIANRKSQGEQLPPVLDKIGELTLKIQSKIEEGAVKQGQFKLGEFITNNAGMLITGILILFVIIFLLGRKK